MDLITLTTKTRGRNSRDVEYKGVGRVDKVTEKDKDGKETVTENVVTDGVLTSIEDALTLPGVDGNLQKVLDFAVIGYNKFQRDAALDVDEFSEYIKPEWAEEKVDAFKRSVRALAKAAEIDIADAAQLVLSKMK